MKKLLSRSIPTAPS